MQFTRTSCRHCEECGCPQQLQHAADGMGGRVIPARRTSHSVRPAMCCRGPQSTRQLQKARPKVGACKLVEEGAWSFLLLRLSPRTWQPSFHRQLARFAKRHKPRRLHAGLVPCVGFPVAVAV